MTTVVASPATRGAASRWRLAVAVVAGVGLLAVMLFVGRWSAPSGSPPGDGSAAAGFARDMAVHHAQAVAMAEIIRDRTADADVRLLATDIALTQQSQIGRMRGWLDVWELQPTGTGPRMAWMGEPMDGPMPGMATSADMDQLRAAPIVDAENLFLTLMIKHHLAGVAMAEAAVDLDVPREVEALSRGIITSQRSEVDVLRQLLADRGERVPEPTEDGMVGDDHGGARP